MRTPAGNVNSCSSASAALSSRRPNGAASPPTRLLTSALKALLRSSSPAAEGLTELWSACTFLPPCPPSDGQGLHVHQLGFWAQNGQQELKLGRVFQEQTLSCFQEHLLGLEAEKAELGQQINHLQLEKRDLLHAKTSLSLEVATYR